MIPLKGIAKIAHSLNIRLNEAEHSAKFQVALRTSIGALAVGFKAHVSLSCLLSDLAHLQNDPNIQCSVPRLVPEDSLHSVRSLLTRLNKNRIEKQEQTPLIPTRLFAAFINGALAQLNALEPHLPKLEAYIKGVYADPHLLCDSDYQWRSNVARVKRLYPDREFSNYSPAKIACVSTIETLQRYELSELYATHNIASFKHLGSFIRHHQILCVMLIHAFSGMRSSEVRAMPYEPVIHQAAKGFGELPVLVSHLKKFEQANYSRALTWATSKEGVYAVEIAKQLARLSWFRGQPINEVFPDNAPLWVAPTQDRQNPQGHYATPLAESLWSWSAWGEVGFYPVTADTFEKRHNVPKECSCPNAEDTAPNSSAKPSRYLASQVPIAARWP